MGLHVCRVAGNIYERQFLTHDCSILGFVPGTCHESADQPFMFNAAMLCASTPSQFICVSHSSYMQRRDVWPSCLWSFWQVLLAPVKDGCNWGHSELDAR